MLVPAVNTALRGSLMHWLDQLDIRPQIVGEFEDRALMQAFGQAAVGVFMSPSVIDTEIARQYRVEAIGSTAEVRERYTPSLPSGACATRRSSPSVRLPGWMCFARR
jgi:LysR family transcriptional activator of nhaA